MAKKKPYSMEFRALRNPRRYLLDGIPPTLWEKARAKARKEHRSMRAVILTLLTAYAEDLPGV